MVKTFFLGVVFLLSLSAFHLCPGQGMYVPPKVPEKYCKALSTAVLQADAGQTEESIAQIKELIAKYPDWTEPRHNLSRIYYDLNRKMDAIETLEGAIVIDTASQIKQLYSLARIYQETGQFDKALPIYQIVISKSTDDEELQKKATANFEKLKSKIELF